MLSFRKITLIFTTTFVITFLLNGIHIADGESFGLIKNYNSKFNRRYFVKFSKGRVQYYKNHVSTFNVILQSGDIEPNPGPGSHSTTRDVNIPGYHF